MGGDHSPSRKVPGDPLFTNGDIEAKRKEGTCLGSHIGPWKHGFFFTNIEGLSKVYLLFGEFDMHTQP